MVKMDGALVAQVVAYHRSGMKDSTFTPQVKVAFRVTQTFRELVEEGYKEPARYSFLFDDRAPGYIKRLGDDPYRAYEKGVPIGLPGVEKNFEGRKMVVVADFRPGRGHFLVLYSKGRT